MQRRFYNRYFLYGTQCNTQRVSIKEPKTLGTTEKTKISILHLVALIYL